MAFIYLLLFISPLFAEPLSLCTPADFWRGESIKAQVPLAPNAIDSIEVRSISNHQRFLDWTALEDKETYEILKKITACWQSKGIAEGYLLFGKTTPNIRSETFSWEIIPFSPHEWSLLKQLQVIYSVSFNPAIVDEEIRFKRGKALQSSLTHLKEQNVEVGFNENSPQNDPFCNPEVIQRQIIGESEHLFVLYDLKPMRLFSEAPHFLIIPKCHRENFNDVTEVEYMEAMTLSRTLISYFKTHSKNPTIYLLHKTGKAAGQTVPHWHLHLIVEENDAANIPYQFPTSHKPENATVLEEPFRQLSELYLDAKQGCKNFLTLLLPRRELTQEELKERVNQYKVIFEETP